MCLVDLVLKTPFWQSLAQAKQLGAIDFQWVVVIRALAALLRALGSKRGQHTIAPVLHCAIRVDEERQHLLLPRYSGESTLRTWLKLAPAVFLELHCESVWLIRPLEEWRRSP